MTWLAYTRPGSRPRGAAMTWVACTRPAGGAGVPASTEGAN